MLSKINHKRKIIQKSGTGIPMTDMTTSIGDHHKNEMQFMTPEQATVKLLNEILIELKKINQKSQ